MTGKLTACGITLYSNAPRELIKLQKKQFFLRLMSLSTIYFKDQPWLRQESGETGCSAQDSRAHHSIVQSISSARIFNYKDLIALV